MYDCYGSRGCYWNGENPVIDKDGKTRCPVCGSEAYKRPAKEGHDWYHE